MKIQIISGSQFKQVIQFANTLQITFFIFQKITNMPLPNCQILRKNFENIL